nr:hypothetical protein [Tanacetum cinerariifolium]
MHLAPSDSTTLLVVDPILSAEDTKVFETDESAPTPTHTSPTYAEAPLAAIEALIDAVAAALPSSPPPSLLTLLSSPLPQIPLPPFPLPSPPLPLLTLSPPLLLPSTTRRDDLPEASRPLQKRACFTAPIGRFEVRESSSAVATRHNRLTLAHRVDYGFINTVDASIRASESRAITTVGEEKAEDTKVFETDESAPTPTHTSPTYAEAPL